MAYSVPSDIPDTLTAGTTWRWTSSYSDFPATEGWTLTYYVAGDEATFTIVADADGAGYSVTAGITTTTGVTPGVVKITPQVSNGTETYPLDAVWRTILPDPATSEAGEHRTHEQKMLEAIESVLEGRITDDVESYSIAGRSLTKIPFAELRKLRSTYAAMVWRQRNPTTAYPQVKVSFGPV